MKWAGKTACQWWSATLILMTLAAFPASAQDVRVRTGEHPTFTRIVIDFEQTPGWQLGRNADRYELWLEDPKVRFDLTDAFRRLQGQRVSGLSDIGGGRLAIDLSCDCGLEVKQLPNQGLLIDVQDQPPSADNPFARPLEVPPSPRPRAIDAALAPPFPTVFPRSPSGPIFIPLAETMPPVLSGAQVASALGLQAALLEQAARAASHGLIDFEIGQVDAARDSSETLDTANPQNTPQAAPPPALAPNIRIETQFDRDTRQPMNAIVREQTFTCLESARLDVAEWFELDRVLADLGRARMDLVDARDRANPGAHARLARMLIYLTFGREARDVLDHGPAAIPDSDLLMELARVVDGEESIGTGILETQGNCDTSGAVWALLASDDIAQPDKVNTPAIVRALSAMPVHLRQHLGPQIAERLVKLGDREAALQVRNAIMRGNAAEIAQIRMLQAKLDLDSGDRVAANANLVAVAESRGVQAGEALAQLIENQIGEGVPVADDLIDQAMALIFELERSPEAAALPNAVVSAMIHNGRFAQALTQSTGFRDSGRLSDAMQMGLRTSALLLLASDADDPTFLTVAVSEAVKGQIPEPARLKIAARLVQLGMAEEARAALGMRADIPTEDERFILAEIAILEGKRSVATSYLTGLGSDRAIALRARAEGLATLTDEAELAARVPAGPESLQSSVPETAAATEGVLQRNRELLAQTREIRDNLLSLLNEGPGQE